MNVYILLPNHRDGCWRVRCKVCRCIIVSQINFEHLVLLMLEHAAEHDRG